MSRVWDDSPYKGAGLLVHLALADCADESGVCWPSQVTLARMARTTPENVRLTLNRMTADGWVEVLAEAQGPGRPKRYRLATPKILGASADGYPKVEGETPKDEGSNTPKSAPKEPSRNHHKEPPISTPAVVDDGFDTFWQAYPRREAKGAARKAWAKAVTLADPAVIIAGALRYRHDPNRDPAFTAHPTTWLNQHRWEDDPLPARGSRTTGQARDDEVASLMARAQQVDQQRVVRGVIGA